MDVPMNSPSPGREEAVSKHGSTLPPQTPIIHRSPSTTFQLRATDDELASFAKFSPMTPGPNDVVLGRSGGLCNHIGNFRFRALVRQYREQYSLANRSDKRKIASELVSKWIAQTPAGRFLVRSHGDEKDIHKFLMVDERRAGVKARKYLHEPTKSRGKPTGPVHSSTGHVKPAHATTRHQYLVIDRPCLPLGIKSPNNFQDRPERQTMSKPQRRSSLPTPSRPHGLLDLDVRLDKRPQSVPPGIHECTESVELDDVTLEDLDFFMPNDECFEEESLVKILSSPPPLNHESPIHLSERATLLQLEKLKQQQHSLQQQYVSANESPESMYFNPRQLAQDSSLLDQKGLSSQDAIFHNKTSQQNFSSPLPAVGPKQMEDHVLWRPKALRAIYQTVSSASTETETICETSLQMTRHAWMQSFTDTDHYLSDQLKANELEDYRRQLQNYMERTDDSTIISTKGINGSIEGEVDWRNDFFHGRFQADL